ncbi:divisome protein SepX/GlpR [Mycobacterium sherrisii]|uniref:Transmembrane protein n=1 Tax=Mycobacterium sherrisii TaxID=243061 RepID=A0A1E3SVU1_9MYCO|nr:gephyrin-like molybdotransferase receptor GlpR [Mycobacterium sherrisii]MCV7031571.1 hypothetical protein [Mycobacterium sherrisii]MEC4763062.1 gephyrin-like molybdotransferase receptor GlpR [Mycobacterium sherrisii]ODR06257.1 hypothetical protein BHQ21_12140 [Mycobacterium sherrisii]ORW86041.1 hypothetical protein AWC25_21155 [Mycobacterium sherrisii]
MPSIPQSLLWISLVVLWLFVLVPMLISKRDAVRRTSDVALATRVLNGGAGSRLLRRTGPAAGHRSDPHWKPEEDTSDLSDRDEADLSERDDAEVNDDHDAETEELRPARPVVMKMPVAEPEYLDVDVVEDSGALPAAADAEVTEPVLAPVDQDDEAEDDEAEDETAEDHLDDEYEYVEDSSGLEPEAEDEAPRERVVPASAQRRRRFDTKTAAAVTARKYAFRKKVLMMMAVILVGSATVAFEVTPSAWWVCGFATTITVLYLGYLRRQTRIEEKVRRRRAQRMTRARFGVENTRDRDYDVVPSRLRRPGAVVLEIDDEDPIFEHLDYGMPQQNYGWPRDLPRAVGQ